MFFMSTRYQVFYSLKTKKRSYFWVQLGRLEEWFMGSGGLVGVEVELLLPIQ